MAKESILNSFHSVYTKEGRCHYVIIVRISRKRGKGPYLYDVRTGWGEGVPKKQTRLLISCMSVTVTMGEGVKKSGNFVDIILVWPLSSRTSLISRNHCHGNAESTREQSGKALRNHFKRSNGFDSRCLYFLHVVAFAIRKRVPTSIMTTRLTKGCLRGLFWLCECNVIRLT